MGVDNLKQLPITRVLEDKGLLGQMKQRHGQLFGPCPVHGGDNPRAFVVTLEKNLWYCFTQCHAGGDVIRLVQQLNKASYPQALHYLQALFGGKKSLSKEKLKPTIKTCADKKTFKPFTQQLTLGSNQSLLKSKGISAQTARLFQAGIYTQPGYLSQCLVVRLHDIKGSPLGYAGRRLDSTKVKKFGKWKFPPQFPKNQILFNFHRIQPHLNQTVVVVECPWGAMRLHQLNIPAVSLLGTQISERQCHLLAPISQVVLLLDGDAAGQNAAIKISQHLQALTRPYIVPLFNGQDPDDLSDAELLRVVRPFFPGL